MSLTVSPLALLFLLKYLKDGTVKNLIFAGLTAAMVGLISPFGLLTYLVFAGIITFSEVLLGSGRAKITKFILVLALTGALSSFWYNPSFFRTTISKLLPISLFLLPILGTFGYLLFDRKPHLQPLFITSFCTIAFFIITAAGGNLVPSSPARYRMELGISASFLIGFILVSLIEFVRFRIINIKLQGKFANVLANSLSPMVSFLLLGFTALTRNPMIYNSDNVLGVWTEVQRGDVWVARDNFMGYHAYIGYAITIMAMGLMVYLVIKDRSTAKAKTIN